MGFQVSFAASARSKYVFSQSEIKLGRNSHNLFQNILHKNYTEFNLEPFYIKKFIRVI